MGQAMPSGTPLMGEAIELTRQMQDYLRWLEACTREFGYSFDGGEIEDECQRIAVRLTAVLSWLLEQAAVPQGAAASELYGRRDPTLRLEQDTAAEARLESMRLAQLSRRSAQLFRTVASLDDQRKGTA